MAAPAGKRILKWAAWLLGGLLAIPVVCYVALVLINWRDQPPSAAALRLASDYRNRPGIPDTDNAYVHLMGFSVAPDVDPRAAGIKRIEWIRSFEPDMLLPPPGDPVTPYAEYGSTRSEVGRKISDACKTGSDKCVTALEQGDDEIDAWLASEQWLLDRYLTLIQHPGWLETLPYDTRAPMIAYRMPFDGQQLLMAKAYISAGQNDAASVRELLGKDARFWRQVLASSDLLITKMVAVGALNRTFEIGNLVVRRLPAELQLAALPEQWTTALSDDERSMLRCLTGEWLWASQVYDQTMTVAGEMLDTDPESEAGFIDAVLNRASMPLFQRQDTKNKLAAMFVSTSEALNVPIEQFSAGFDEAQHIFGDPIPGSPFAKLYNPIGNILLAIGAGSYPLYPQRVADVEGVRRAAVLAAEVRARKLDRQNIAAELAASQIRTPYTGEPFTWNATEQAIIFVGMDPSERGRHAFKY